MKRKRSLVLTGLVVVAVMFLGALAPLVAQALDRSVSQRVMKSVVQIIAAVRGSDGSLRGRWSGSGTIVSADGLILTNCHVANPRAMWNDPQFDYDVLIVALTGRSDEPPQPTFLAQVVQYDPALDLAVIRVTQYLDGRKVDPARLNLPALTLGDSDDLEVGDPLYIFGFPGIGGDTLTFTSGNVSGFTREQGVAGRAWIKTDATIAGGNSGGTGVNDKGVLIGVPTQGGSGSGDQVVDCRHIADTNGDGTIDDRDACVPMGGFINALRPINLAKPLIEAAGRGLAAPPAPSPQPSPTPPAGKAGVSRLIFAPAVNDYDQPVTVVDSFPSGTQEIYLLFDYKNFADGAVWQPVLVLNGKTYNDIWPAANWNGGASGMWWISIQNNPLVDGTYKFDLLYNSKSLGSATVTVGGKAQSKPTFRNIVFWAGKESGYVLPAGAGEIKATFEYANLTSANAWSYIWYHQGTRLARGNGPAFSKAAGTAETTLSSKSGLSAGNYRLELFLDGKLAATADFILGGKAGGTGQLFGPIVFAEGVDPNDKPVRSGTSFRYGMQKLYAFFDYSGMQDGWSWTRRWYIDGEVVVEAEDTWEGGAGGNWWVSVSNEGQPLPAGKYELELLVEGSAMQRGSCTIGSGGAAPTPTPKPADGVRIYGRISDADTGKGIQGAIFLVLQPGITIDEFTWSDDEVYTYAETDRYGDYRLPLPLARGAAYSMIVAAESYSAILEDDITIRSDLKSPFELNLTLQRQ